MSEMVKRVARAMVTANGFDPDERVFGVMTRVEAYLPTARAAIEAMREPTMAMFRASAKAGEFSAVHNYGSPATDETIWNVMLDAALDEAPHA